VKLAGAALKSEEEVKLAKANEKGDLAAKQKLTEAIFVWCPALPRKCRTFTQSVTSRSDSGRKTSTFSGSGKI